MFEFLKKKNNNEKVNEDFKRFFTIGENHISTIIPTEQDALNQIKRLTNILNIENGFYNEFSAPYDGRILTYITLYYPNLLDQSTYLIQKFRAQNLEIYQKFFTGDKNINYKFLISGIISDMYHIDNVIVNTLDFIHYFYPTPLNKTLYQDKLQQTREFLLETLDFTNDGNIIETLRNYDIVCWYYFNSVIKNPNITLSKEVIEETIVIQTITLPLFKDDIKRRYGIE